MTTVTLVFTDLVNSTAVKALLPGSDARARNEVFVRTILVPHRQRMEAKLAAYGGRVVSTAGDGYFMAFTDATQAVQWSVSVQQSHADDPIETPQGPVRLRIGMHTGAPLAHGEDYIGEEVDYAARVSGLGGSGQILLSEATASLVRAARISGFTLHPHPNQELKGIGRVEVLEVLYSGREPMPLKASCPNNVPASATAFIGRKSELAAMTALLVEEGVRLVTLTGPAGMGKTQSSLQVARLCATRHTEQFPDGVWWVPLEEARTAEGVFPRVAHHLRLDLQPQPSVEEQVCRHLQTRKLLLVLDNTEQIPDAGKAVSSLLRDSPGIQVLLTTRRVLELREERAVEVPPMTVEEAIELFADRARARASTFEVTDANRADIEELCRRLENVPLAIELAASRSAAMTPREILERLREPLRLLQVRDPNRPVRQTALRAALDWSYDLLTPDDQSLLAQLSVFRGGFTLGDAEAICDAFDVFEGVSELRRHSLLRSEIDPASQRTRYRMIEAVGEYAGEKLAAEDGVRSRHAAHFLEFAEACAAQDRTHGEADALRGIEIAFENIRTALMWSMKQVLSPGKEPTTDARGVSDCARLTLAFGWFLQRRGFWALAREITRRTLSLGEALTPIQRAKLLLRDADLTFDMGTLDEAKELAERVLAETPIESTKVADASNRETTARALNLLGLIAWKRKDSEEARRLYTEALEIWRSLGDAAGVAVCLINVGSMEQHVGSPEEARRVYEEAAGLARRTGDQRGLAEVANNLGVLAHAHGDLALAYVHYREFMQAMQELGSKAGVAVALNNIGEALEELGNPVAAAKCYSASLNVFRSVGSNQAEYPAQGLIRIGIAPSSGDPTEVVEMVRGADKATGLPGAEEMYAERLNG